MSRGLLGYGDKDFFNLCVSNIIKLDDKKSLDDYTFSVNNNSELELKKGSTVIATFTTSGVIFNGTVNATTLQDADATTKITTDVVAENLIFTTNSNEIMRIADDGNIGIGTNNPSHNLHIVEISNSLKTILQVENASSGTSAGTRLVVNSDFGGLNIDTFGSLNPTTGSEIQDGARIQSNTNASGGLLLEAKDGTLKLWTGDNERITIESGGDVGIGITNPSRALEIVGDITHKNSFSFRERTTDQTIANLSVVDISFDTEVINFDSNIDYTLTSATVITINTSGLYYASYTLPFDGNATGQREVWISCAGVIFAHQLQQGVLTQNIMSASALLNCSVNDTVKLVVFQSSGGNLGVDGGGRRCYLQLYKIGSSY